MAIRYVPCLMLFLCLQVQSMENCILLSDCTRDFDFNLLFAHPEYTSKEIEAPAEIESLYIEQLIEKHFCAQESIAKNVVTRKDIKKCLKSNPNANINSADNQGRTLMDVAVDLRDIELIKYLKNKGMNLEQKDNYGFTIYRRTIVRGIMDTAILNLLYLSKG